MDSKNGWTVAETSKQAGHMTRDLRNQFLRFETETETEQVQSQQARPRLKRYSLNKRDQDSYSRIFETETRNMCIFKTESLAEPMKYLE